jgi:metallo-beta-lactamase family protein
VYSLEMLSAHADAAQIVEWLKTAPRAPAVTFLNHGEPDAADALRLRIERTLGWAVKTPQFGDLYSLGAIQRGAETAAVVPAASSSIESEEMS